MKRRTVPTSGPITRPISESTTDLIDLIDTSVLNTISNKKLHVWYYYTRRLNRTWESFSWESRQ